MADFGLPDELILPERAELNDGEIVDTYKVIKHVGGGHFGMVYEVEDISTKQKFALKFLSLKNGLITPNITREITLLYDINHDNVVRFKKAFLYDNRRIGLVMELMDGDLREVISNAGPISNECVQAGGAKYSAPEVLLGARNYGKEADMWSVGCIFAELVTRGPAFNFRETLLELASDPDKDLSDALLLAIFRKLGTPTETTWPGPGVTSFERYPKDDTVVHPLQAYDVPETFDDLHGRSMLQQLLQVVPANRMAIDEARNHPYYPSA